MHPDTLRKLVRTLRPLNLTLPFVPSLEEQEYFDYYHLNIAAATHHLGYVKHGSQRLAVQAFLPVTYSAAVVCIHGYLEHGAYFRHAVQALVRAGFAVLLVDLPGHGLSGGKPADIRNFSQYAAAVDCLYRFAVSAFPVPVHLIGHSMGGSALLEWLFAGKGAVSSKIVFAAPLVHTKLWQATRAVYQLLVPAVTWVPRTFPPISSDKEFMKFTMSADPLLRKRIPLTWVSALLRWNERFEGYRPLQRPALLVQGGSDRLIDAAYTVAALRRKLPQVTVTRIKPANHQLFNEAPKYRAAALKTIVAYLAETRAAASVDPK
jgi:alpha-beta hydrolase superfamily lysophospholipase